MILPGNTVQLTKIHYYNNEIPTISREIFDNHINSRVRIEKNLFRHRWVLKINEIGGGRKKFQWRFVVYITVLSCLIVAVVFGLYFTYFGKITKKTQETIITFVKNESSTSRIPTLKLSNTHEKVSFVIQCARKNFGHQTLTMTTKIQKKKQKFCKFCCWLLSSWPNMKQNF